MPVGRARRRGTLHWVTGVSAGVMDARTKIGILLIVYAVQVTLSAPSRSWDAALDPGYRVRRAADKETGRVFWSSLGDILESLPFLPLTVNVPDTLSAMWSFFTGFLPGSSSGTKRPKRNSTVEAGITRDDLLDYLLY